MANQQSDNDRDRTANEAQTGPGRSGMSRSDHDEAGQDAQQQQDLGSRKAQQTASSRKDQAQQGGYGSARDRDQQQQDIGEIDRQTADQGPLDLPLDNDDDRNKTRRDARGGERQY